jgi:arylsulfatase A
MSKIYLLVLALLASLALSISSLEIRPNIILIQMDDLGVEEIQPYHPGALPSPNLNRMAAEGLKFTRYYCGVSVCAPSRASLMTGLHTGHTQIRGNIQMKPHGQLPLTDEQVTVAELLKKAGYHTALIGKWGLGIENSSGEPTRQGFDQYYGYLDQVLAHNAFPAYLVRNGVKEPLKNVVVWDKPGGFTNGLGSYATTKKQYANDLFYQESLQFLGKKQQQPFFLYLNFTMPHNNGEAPVADRFESPSIKAYAKENWTDTEKHYAASLRRMDDYLGGIMATLRKKGLDQNTFVFFMSDNGSTEDIPERFSQHFTLRGKKRSPFEGGLRSPLLVWGAVKPGTCAGAATHWDFLPTACELANIAIPSGLDGISYAAALKGQHFQAGERTLYWEFHERNPWRAMMKGDWKIIEWMNTGQVDLYNLAKDTGEKQSVHAEEATRTAAMKQALQVTRTPSEVFNFGRKR